MEFLWDFFVAPFLDMIDFPIFLAEVAVSGLLTGVMYSLVALGFVLIFKASQVFNFAQGAMVLFAALTLVGLMEHGVPVWGALPVTAIVMRDAAENLYYGMDLHTAIVMVALAFAIERGMLRPLINQPPITLFMATIGLSFLLEGAGEWVWGSNVKALDLGIPNSPVDVGGMLLNEFDLIAALVAAVLVTALALLFQHTPMGRALRAVADDPQAALSLGISLRTIWIIVWSVAGVVAIVAGIMWGAKSGVQFSLSLIALKALPVLILGGLTWFAYMLAMLVLMFRPQGLFGEKIIERV